MSEKTRGSKGILPSMPHFWLFTSSANPVAEELLELRCCMLGVTEPFREGTVLLGKSNICNVDLSEVTASNVLSGDIAIE